MSSRRGMCVYTDFISGGDGEGSPLSSADESFSDSETSSNAPDTHRHNPGQVAGLAYLSELFTSPTPCSSDGSPSTDSESGGRTGGGGNGGFLQMKNKAGRKPCKYVPHREKPVQVVEKRNARERRRVEAVNSAFVRLRRMVPHENRRKRISKVKTLRIAIDYINYLQDMIDDHDNTQLQEMTSGGPGGVPGGGSFHGHHIQVPGGGIAVGGIGAGSVGGGMMVAAVGVNIHGGSTAAGAAGGMVGHPAYIQQASPGWGCGRNRDELTQGSGFVHQQQQHSHLSPEYMTSSTNHSQHPHHHSHHHIIPAQQYHQHSQHFYQQETQNENSFGVRRASEYASPDWTQTRVQVYGS